MTRILCTAPIVLMLVLAASGDQAISGAQAGHAHDKHFSDCAKACAECTNSCASCYHHCAGLVSAGKKDHTKSMILCNDCAEVCGTAAKLVSRQSPFSRLICEACAKTCDDCGAACAKFSEDKHMTDCAKACKDCATACREMIKHVPH